MSHPSVIGAPWRVLILDRDPADPKWLLATVTLPADVRPAVPGPLGRYPDFEDVASWVRDSVGHPVRLVPVSFALAWRVDEEAEAR
jgi:hypothetical protein